MKELNCGDVIEGCKHQIRGESDEEVMRRAAEHAREKHGVEEVDANTAAIVRSKIRNV